MRRNLSSVVLCLVLMFPAGVHADILNLRGGVGTIVQKDRDTNDSTRYGLVDMAVSYRTPSTEFALGLPLRWDAKTREFDRDVWDRKGDWLRPVSLLRYGSGRFKGGLEIFDDWTPGAGFLVRDLSGRGEIDYTLPGLRLRWSKENLEVDAGMDRPIDPTVQAVALKWQFFKGITLVLEGAVDPEAPFDFTGSSADGRPRAETSERLTAQAAGMSFQVVEGKIVDVTLGAHAADINGEAKGRGADLTTTFDFSHSYLHRLKLSAGSVSCEGGYLPAWFGDIYPVHRWGPSGQTFLQLNPLGSAVPDKRMLSYRFQYDLGGFFSVSGGLDSFDDDSMTRARFEAKLKEENGRGLEISLWSRADDPDARLFSDDANLYSRTSALYNILPHLLLNVSYDHAWAFQDEDARFAPVNSIVLGVMYDISL